MAAAPISSRLKRESRECPEHGAYVSASINGEIWTECPTCVEIEQAKERSAAAITDRLNNIRQFLRKAGVPPRFWEASLENFLTPTPRHEMALNVAQTYAADFASAMRTGRSLAFVGEPGTGKTHLAVGIIREVLAQGGRAMLTTVGDYVREVKDFCWNKKAEIEADIIAKHVSPDLLVLDEVGVQFGSKTEENLIFTLIDKRYNEVKPTIVISNEDEAGLESYLGRRTFDRLKDNGGALVGFAWASMRGDSAKNVAANRQEAH